MPVLATEPQFACPTCRRKSPHPITGVCTSCEANAATMLGEIVVFATHCANLTHPERTGAGGHSVPGPRSPANDARIDYAHHLGWTDPHDSEGSDPNPNWTNTQRQAHQEAEDAHRLAWDRNGLDMLHGWINDIIDGRQLATRNHKTGFRGIVEACTLLTTHLEWAAQQTWADGMLTEIREIHHAGLVALKAVPPRRGRIECPGDDPETGDVCGETIWMPEEFSDYITQPGEHAPKRTLWCRNCTTTWTIERLMRVAVEVHGVARLARGFGRDTTARMLGISEHQLRRRITAERKTG